MTDKGERKYANLKKERTGFMNGPKLTPRKNLISVAPTSMAGATEILLKEKTKEAQINS